MSYIKKELEAMLESLIKNDSDAASDHLHKYMTVKARQMVVGEGFDDDDEDTYPDEDDEMTATGEEMGDDGEDDDGDDGDEDTYPDEDDEMMEAAFSEKSPSIGKQPMTGMGGGSKMGKYKLSGDSISSEIKGDSLKNSGRKETKAFTEKPKDAPEYKDGVVHKAGSRKNRAKVR